MTRQWIYLINTFLICTEGSYRLSVRISRKHDAALQAAAAGLDPFYVAMYAEYHPFHVALVAAYNAWKAQGGTQESQTLSVAQLIRLLSGTKIEIWMNAVKVFYGKDTVRFMELFPDLKKAFQQGSKGDRIAAVAAFILAIGADINLATLKIQVQLFYTQLNNAETTQQGGIFTTSGLSHDLEEARKVSAVGQFADYGGLIQKFAATPDMVGNFFDKTALRDGSQVIFHHKVKKNSRYTICKHTCVSTDEWTLENEGDTALDFGLVLHTGDKPAGVFVTVPAHSNVTVLATALTSDLANNHYLVAANNDLLLDGEFTAEIL